MAEQISAAATSSDEKGDGALRASSCERNDTDRPLRWPGLTMAGGPLAASSTPTTAPPRPRRGTSSAGEPSAASPSTHRPYLGSLHRSATTTGFLAAIAALTSDPEWDPDTNPKLPCPTPGQVRASPVKMTRKLTGEEPVSAGSSSWSSSSACPSVRSRPRTAASSLTHTSWEAARGGRAAG
eukprot:CAMPEP_0201114276 /NCGR_PEP_ID=MMETSP0812-20130820/78307_1 /ASSEMBLY_ACC=CAM_ASM_000668 /TAXON_ID=98059 /ORGANISM="Dinobryon sp., Strain UTEXLB2267" /LENGTH=181 /DNA_ID=CAMNT_0047377895 /DNA_START=1959 /DNA_END=2504 /DNA_ORIENTATION=+